MAKVATLPKPLSPSRGLTDCEYCDLWIVINYSCYSLRSSPLRCDLSVVVRLIILSSSHISYFVHREKNKYVRKDRNHTEDRIYSETAPEKQTAREETSKDFDFCGENSLKPSFSARQPERKKNQPSQRHTTKIGTNRFLLMSTVHTV